MKTRIEQFTVGSMLALAFLAAFLFAYKAVAAEPAICAIATSTSTSVHTGLPDGGAVNVKSMDGGTSGLCTWGPGATVLVQCTQDVYVDSTYDGGSPNASSLDNFIDFTNNKDPYIVYLGTSDKDIAVLAKTTAGICTFSTSLRRKPY